ncbi:MAG TPA: DUF6529 family protein [Actinotalea sp.]|jgi:hypothetical protein
MDVRTNVGGGRVVLAGVTTGALVSVALGVYGRVHTPSAGAVPLFGFDTVIHMKVWLALATGVLVLGQLVTALWMYGRLGRPAPPRLGLVHRTLGLVALVVSLPVAYYCLWSIGFGSYSARVLAHSLAGCLVYGAFVVKVVGLHAPAAPRWLVPVAGGTLFTLLVVTVLTSAGWYLTSQGLPGGSGY